MSRIRIVIAEPQPLYLRGLTHELEAAGDIEIVGTATTGEEVITTVKKVKPDLVILATALPDMAPLDVLQSLKNVPVLCTGEDSRQLVYDAILHGARGYLHKRYSDVEVPDAVRRIVTDDEYILGNSTLALFIEAVRERAISRSGRRQRHNGDPLSTRELEVLSLLAEGHTQPGIASILKLSRSTVQTHIRSIYMRLGVTSATAAVSEGIGRRLIRPGAPGPRTSR